MISVNISQDLSNVFLWTVSAESFSQLLCGSQKPDDIPGRGCKACEYDEECSAEKKAGLIKMQTVRLEVAKPPNEQIVVEALWHIWRAKIESEEAYIRIVEACNAR